MPETKDIRYGLYWKAPNEEESVVTRCKKELPFLKEIKTKRMLSKDTGSDAQMWMDYDPGQPVDSPTHILIEGDNYHALAALNFTHRGKVDVIVIDPPYNTGNKDFMYNDNWVDKEDTERHSKWLSFMYRRLKLCKHLLKDDGAIFIHIDDNEMPQLKLLCDEIFGENNFVECIAWDKKSSAKGVPPKNMIVNVHEYILVYQKSNKFSFIGIPRKEDDFANPDGDKRGIWRNTNIKSTTKNKSQSFSITDPTNGNIFTDTWAYSKDELDRLIKENYLIFPKNREGQVRKKEFYNEFKNINIPMKSSLGLFDNQKNTEMLKDILPNSNFPNPKPLDLIKYLLRMACRKDGIVLDFFGGSGTTMHATLELNKEDGGNRQCILVTNNENNICTEICYPRISKVMKGYINSKGKKVEGLGGSLKYYKVDFEEVSKNKDQAVFDIAKSCRDLLREKEGIRNLAIGDMHEGKDYEVFSQDGKSMAIYYHPKETGSFNEVRDIMNNIKGKRILYYFCLDPNGYSPEEFDGWDEKIEKKPIPYELLNIYDRIFRDKK